MSTGHICFHSDVEFFHGPNGTLYRANKADPINTSGYRPGSFECQPRADQHVAYLQTAYGATV